MANILTTHAIFMYADVNLEADEVSLTGGYDFTADFVVGDADDSGTLSTGDWYWVSGYDFAGFTIQIDGREYGVFEDTGAPGEYYIPHLGELSYATLPASPIPITQTNDATVYNCFLTDTMIQTPAGETAVQSLKIGETVRTIDGRDVTVKWVGVQSIKTIFGPAERLLPVRISAGALGNGVPHSDLTVTTDHALFVEGILCHAAALINDRTIKRVPLAELGETYTVYHIETEEHEIILANGAPAETFIDNVSRRVFDNFAEFEALYGDVPEMEELPYPRAMSVRQVPNRILARLCGRRSA